MKKYSIIISIVLIVSLLSGCTEGKTTGNNDLEKGNVNLPVNDVNTDISQDETTNSDSSNINSTTSDETTSNSTKDSSTESSSNSSRTESSGSNSSRKDSLNSNSSNQSKDSSSSNSSNGNKDSSSSNSSNGSKDSSSSNQSTTQKPPNKKPINVGKGNKINYSIQKGVWISYIDKPIKANGMSESTYRAKISKALKDFKNMGGNTVYVHVRSHSDAYYNSSLFPKSYRTSTTFDQLKVMVKEAHNLGLSFHAWINPMRGPTESVLKNTNNKYPIKKWYNDSSKKGKYIVQTSGRYWLNPAYPEVRKLISDGVKEIVTNYDVDAIHIDDYFYPTTSASFDQAAYNIYGKGKSLSDFRLNNATIMVKSIYDTIKSANNNILFGISPQGNINNNYISQYSDVKKWAGTPGYCDYIMPQMYWTEKRYFENRIDDWSNMIKTPSVKLVIGLGLYKAVSGGGYGFVYESNIMKKQIEYCETLSKYSGVALFRYDNFTNGKYSQTEAKGISEAFK